MRPKRKESHAGRDQGGIESSQEARENPGVIQHEHRSLALTSHLGIHVAKDTEKSSLHKFGKADPPECPCGRHTQDGHPHLPVPPAGSIRDTHRSDTAENSKN